jgi:ribonuclease G
LVNIAVSVRRRIARIALLNADTLTEYTIWNLDHPDGLGDILTGRITARIPSMAGSFVDLGNDLTGFLPDTAGANLPAGTILTVTITRAAQSGKGPRLAAAHEPAGAKPGLIRPGPGPLLELAARFPAAPITIDDYSVLAELRRSLGTRITHSANSFDPILEDEIATLYAPAATLPGGAVIHIAPTPALTAIDIDSAAATTTNQLTLNTALIPALIRQITLRNLSGAILIDFVGLKSRHRPKLAAPLTLALAADPLPTKFHGFTTLGFAELSRPRLRPPLHEMPQ